MTDSRLVVPTSVARKDCARAGTVLGRAFATDPLWSVLMPDTQLRIYMFAGLVRMVRSAGGVAERTEGFEGVALWLPPGRQVGLGAVVRSGFAPARWLPKTPWRLLRQMMAVQRQIEDRRKRLALAPRWDLMVLGVDPDHQGRGVGSALVRAGMGRADGGLVYVDTSAEQNVGFYRRFGFEVIDTMRLADPEVPFWMMVRPPLGPTGDRPAGAVKAPQP